MAEKKTKTRTYSTDDISVVWQPQLCVHSGKCVRGLPGVFKPSEQPWVNPANATTEELKAQIDKCPSGALSYIEKDSKEGEEKQVLAEQVIEVIENGPLIVQGNICVKYADGSEEIRERKTAFCRCGASENKPLCDGAHKRIEFKG